MYEILANQNNDLFYDICIYLLPNDKSSIESKECPKCTYLNENLNGTCIMCFSKLTIQSKIEEKKANLFDCVICLEKNISFENEFVLKKCRHTFCK
jgi:hypothetical protein